MSHLVDEPWLRVELHGKDLLEVTAFDHPMCTVERVLEEVQPCIESHAPLRFLTNVAEAGEIALADRWKLAARMKQNREYIHRSAVIGLSSARLFMFNVIVRASGRKHVKAFASREEAVAWLDAEG